MENVAGIQERLTKQLAQANEASLAANVERAALEARLAAAEVTQTACLRPPSFAPA
jgi:hypothetical protein